MRFSGNTVVISPHFVDAALSCGDWLAASPGGTVLTVYSAVPPSSTPVHEWDRRCGFGRADQAVMARQAENRAAMAVLGAQGLGLGLLDERYEGPQAEPGRLTGILASALTTLHPAIVLVPMGLFQDHARVAEAALTVWGLFERPLCDTWLLYEEAQYRHIPGLVQTRLCELSSRGIMATPVAGPVYRGDRKVRALSAYARQLGPLGLTPGQGDSAAPEHYWHLTRGTER